MSEAEASKFTPGLFLADNDLPEGIIPPDLLILNQPIASFNVLSRLWRHAKYRICADGGANRLYDMFDGNLETQRGDYVSERKAYPIHDQRVTDCSDQLPDSIHGDLDSLRDDVRTYYASLGVDVSQDHDQYSTDFGKAMQKIASRAPSSSQREVLVLGTLAARVDQGLGLLHEMLREERRDQQLRLWLVSESNISFILRVGGSIIEGVASSAIFTENVGLLPIYGPAVITTSGLEWDVENWETEMGKQVSTSNHIVADDVRVHTNASILFTIERAHL